MHLFQTIYCRTAQLFFRLLHPFLPYRDPVRLSDTLELPAELQRHGVDRVLIVSGKTTGKSTGMQRLTTALHDCGIQTVLDTEITPDPTVATVEAARLLYLQNHCNGIIGFGGGSAIDCAKAVGARIAKPRQTIPQMKGVLRVRKKTPFLAAIPTTAGTGSEVTLATVITDETTHRKFPISDFCLIPDCAVLDAENTRSLPPFFTATTGMDAITHAVEAYIGRSATKAERADAASAFRSALTHLERAYENGNDIAARKEMLEASYLAGRAFSKAYVGYCHAIAHSLGGAYHIPHGLANAVLLPHVLRAYGTSVQKRLKELAVAAQLSEPQEDAAIAAEHLIDRLEDLNRRLSLPTVLPEVRPEDIPMLARCAAAEANPLYPVPRLMAATELEPIYRAVMNA